MGLWVHVPYWRRFYPLVACVNSYTGCVPTALVDVHMQQNTPEWACFVAGVWITLVEWYCYKQSSL